MDIFRCHVSTRLSVLFQVHQGTHFACSTARSHSLIGPHRAIQIIIGWLVLSVIALLFGSGGFVAIRALKVSGALVDSISFYWIMYNFSIIGVLSVFWKGPPTLKQAYLIVVSVIMAFIITLLPDWTAWVFICALAIYGKCGVQHHLVVCDYLGHPLCEL